MDRRTIKELLAKYYNGESSDAEEQILRYYFHSGEVPDEFRYDQELFRSMHDEKSKWISGISFDKMINEALSGHVQETRSIGLPRLMKSWFRAAAAVILLAGLSGALYLSLHHKETHPVASYTITDPELAYAEAKKALMMVSENLNKGTAGLGKLQSFQYGLEKVNTLSIINRMHNN